MLPCPEPGTGLPLPVAPRCVPPPASFPAASRHQCRARVTLEFVVRLPLVSPVSPNQELYLPASTAAEPDPWRLRIVVFPPSLFYSPSPPPANFASRDPVRGLRCSRSCRSLEVASPLPHPGPGPRPNGECEVVTTLSVLSLGAAHASVRA